MFVFQYFRCVYIQNNMQIIPLYEMTGGMLESSDGQVVCLWNVVSQTPPTVFKSCKENLATCDPYE